MYKKIPALIFLFSISLEPVNADWSDFFDIFDSSSQKQNETQASDSLISNTDIIAGLKEALEKGSRIAVNQLGQKNGFLENPKVKIPMPESLQKVESALRTLKQDKMADEFVLTMNRAAEQATPKTLDILVSAIQGMNISDARQLLQGGDTAATDYFRRKSTADLKKAILPIVQKTTAQAGVTQRYKNLFNELGFMANFINMDSFNIDEYVSNKTIDGLFLVMEDQEQLIRKDPAARTTELLKKVFDSYTSNN